MPDERELLIETVRQYPELYDPEHEMYKVHSKEDLWTQVARDSNLPTGDQARRAWKKLRDSYRDAKKRYLAQARSGSLVKKWKYLDAMSFLDEFSRKREYYHASIRADVPSDEDNLDMNYIKNGTTEDDADDVEERTIEVKLLNLKKNVIECVQKYPALYNTSHDLYYTAKAKNEIWDQIAKECQIKSTEDAKRIWRNLRHNFRNATLRARKGQPPRWKLYDNMLFLEVFMDDFSIKEDDLIGGDNSSVEDMCVDGIATNSKDKNIPNFELVEFEDSVMSINGNCAQEENTNKVVVTGKRKLENIETATDVISDEAEIYVTDESITTNIEYETKRKKVKNNEAFYRDNAQRSVDIRSKRTSDNEESYYPKNLALFNFFCNLYETAVHFPPNVQCRMKRKVFNIMTEFEKELIVAKMSRNEAHSSDSSINE